MLSFLVFLLLLITYSPKREGGQRMSVFIPILMGFMAFLSWGHMIYVTGGAAREKDFQTAFESIVSKTNPYKMLQFSITVEQW